MWLVNIEVPIFVCILGPSIICLLQEEQSCVDENYHLGISHPDRKNITPKHAKTTKQYDNKRKMNRYSFVKLRKCLIVILLCLREDKTGIPFIKNTHINNDVGFSYEFLTMIQLKLAFFFDFGKAKLKLRPFEFLVVYESLYAQRSHMPQGN